MTFVNINYWSVKHYIMSVNELLMKLLIIVNHLSKFEELKKKMHDHMCQGSGLIVLGFSPVLPEFPDLVIFLFLS